MLRQALDAGLVPECVLFRDPVEAETRPLQAACHRQAPVCTATRGVFFKVLGLGYETATQVLAVFSVPRHDAVRMLADAEHAPGGLYLVGEGIQDPRNVGVLVRTAEGLGVHAFALSEDSAWPWSRQALRSTTGSLFRLPTYRTPDVAKLLRDLRHAGVWILGTSAQGDREIADVPVRYPCAVLLGNETAGISEPARAACNTLVRIPMRGGAHSLNVTVAAGIVLHEVARRPRA